ncbi:MAG: helix-turn-helix domain-containing protein [Oscillospiraceae bacterium]
MTPLEKIRLKKGYKTQKELATILGTNRVNVTRWEMGTRYPRPEMLIKLSKMLEVPEREIIEAISRAKVNS